MRVALLSVCVAGCIAAEPAAPDVASETTVDVPAEEGETATGECRLDVDCEGRDACTQVSCEEGKCVSAAKTCEDGNACTIDGCDPASGCVIVEMAKPGAPCRVGNGSNSCEGEVYHLDDVCDGEGTCHENGSRDCRLEAAGPCHHYGCVITEFGGGCEPVPRQSGLACNADGRSEECFEGTLHAADQCVDGECVDGGAIACPTGFCERALCTADGGCAKEPIGVERTLTGSWKMFELYAAGTPDAPRFGTVEAGFTFASDGTVTTFGALTSVPSAPPGDGDYCLSNAGEFRFALPYGAVAPQPRKVYRGVLDTLDDLALVFREGEPSLGVLVRLPALAPTLHGSYRVVGMLRRNAIGARALLGRMEIANGCLTGGSMYSSDELEPLNVVPGECISIFAWLIGLRLSFDVAGESYVLRGTAIQEGDLAVLTMHTDTETVGDGLVFLVREEDYPDGLYNGHHTFARIDTHDEITSSSRGEAMFDAEAANGPYTSYEEHGLDGTSIRGGQGGVFASWYYLGGHREEWEGAGGDVRLRLGQGTGLFLGRLGLLVDVEVPKDFNPEDLAAPLGASLRLTIIRP